MAIDEVLLVGGAAGVGKSSVGWEMSVQLKRAGIAHWFLEGDALDAAWPRPPDDLDGSRLSVKNLRAMAEVFGGAGYIRCIYAQTASVIAQPLVRAALGQIRMQGFLLTATEATRIARLAQREIGTDLDRHVRDGATMARNLQANAPDWVVRIPTDDRPVDQVAETIISAAGWEVTPQTRP